MRDFASPPSSFAPLLHWLWQGRLSEAALRRQLRAMQQAGCGGVVLRPHPLSSPPPLDAQWLRLLRGCIAECKTLDLQLWLSDELGTSHGRAHGATIPPELRAHYLRFQAQDVPLSAAAHWIPPHIAGNLLCAVAVPTDGQGHDFSRAVELLSTADTPARRLISLDSDVRIYVFWQESDDRLDLLNPAAVQWFVQHTHEAYRAALGPEFGVGISGFSLDAPTLWHEEIGATRQCFPWSPRLPRAFQTQHGYDLTARLPSLIAPTGDDAARVRQDFWVTVAHSLQESLWQPLSDWARTRGLEYTGHLTLAGQQPLNIAHSADNVAFYRTLQRSGVAISIATEDEADTLQTGLAARLCASVAALEGKPRMAATLSQDGACATLAARVTALSDAWQGGVNGVTIAPGAVCAGPDLESHPATELNQPYWTQWKSFADYLARYSYALGQGRPGACIGVLLATRSEWAHYHPRGHRFNRWVSEDLNYAIRLLDELHYDCLLLPEDDLIAATCEEDRLLCGRTRLPLEMLIVPGVTTLSWAAWTRIEEFVAAGGKVACLGLLPRWSERGRDGEFEEHIGKATLQTVDDLYVAYAAYEKATDKEAVAAALPTVGYPISREHRSGGRLCCYQPRLNPDSDDARLRVRQILKESVAPEIETQSPHIRYTRRVAEEGELFYLVNVAAETQHINLRLRPSCDGAPFLLDAWTGAIQPVPVRSAYPAEEGGGFNLEMDFMAHESHLIWVRPAPELPHSVVRATFTVEAYDGSTAHGYVMENTPPRIAIHQEGRLIWHAREPVTIPAPLLLPDEWSATRCGPNVALVEDWLWRPGRHAPAGAGAPGRDEVPIEWQPLDRTPARPSALSGIVTFLARFAVEQPPATLFTALAVTGEATELFLNGTRLQPCASPYPDDPLWSDDRWRWFDVRAARAGVNSVHCVVDFGSAALWPGIDVPRLAGEFSYTEHEALTVNEPLLLSDGSWHEQGLPFYSGALDYQQRIDIPAAWAQCRVFLELSRMHDVAEAFLNGRSCGVRIAAPYRFDVSEAMSPGTTHEVRLRVWNTAEAALVGHSRQPSPSGLLGPARLVAYPLVAVTVPR